MNRLLTLTALVAVAVALCFTSTASAASPVADAARGKAYCYKTDYGSGINHYTPCFRSSAACYATVRASRKANRYRKRSQRERIIHGCRKMRVPSGTTVR